MKHVDIKFHFIRDLIEEGTIKLHYVASENNNADILTKSLDRVKFEKLKTELGVIGLDKEELVDTNSGN
jgi:hypothetical protein